MLKHKRTIFFITILLIGLLLIIKFIDKLSSMNPGKEVYTTHCAPCHGKDGLGLHKLVPPLAHADWIDSNNNQLACVIRYGIKKPIVVNGVEYNEWMLGNETLTDIQITNLINYIHSNWGNNLPYVTLDEVEEQLARCP